MKARELAIALLAIWLCVGTVALGEEKAEEERGYIGIRMDARPLPELLTKHLGLDEEQGVRIQNVGKGTPADKAGLERDDIIIAFNGDDVTDNEKFAKSVQEAGVGTEISLEIIHLGSRKKVMLKLTSFAENSKFKAKFPPEPQLVESWQPGRMFQFQPDVDTWIQVGPRGGIFDGRDVYVSPDDFTDAQINRFFRQVYTFRYSSDDEDYTVTIEGSADDEDAKVIVRIGADEHTTTVGKIDKLPKKYREAAEQAVKKARRTAKTRRYKWNVNTPVLPKVPDLQIWKHFNERPDIKHRFTIPHFGPGGDMYERIEKQMRQLQKRIEELERERGKGSDSSVDEDDQSEPEEREESGDKALNKAEKI